MKLATKEGKIMARNKFADSFTLFLTFILLLLPINLLGQQAREVTVGVIGTTGEGPFYIALEKGYFGEVGLKAKMEKFASASKAMGVLAAGHLQVFMAGGPNPALFNGVARGMPLVLVAAGGRIIPGHNSHHIMVRNDLKGEIKGVEDFKGKRFALNSPGSATFYEVSKVLASAGLSVKDVKITLIPFPEMAVAYARKVIDFSIQIEPLATLEQAKEVSFKWKPISDLVKNPYMQISALFYNSDWARENEGPAKDFLLAYLKGVREYHLASRGGPNRKEVVSYFIKYTPVKDPKLYDAMQWVFIDPNGRLDLESIRDQQSFWHRAGQVPVEVPMEKLVDNRYLDYALEKLGEWKER